MYSLPGGDFDWTSVQLAVPNVEALLRKTNSVVISTKLATGETGACIMQEHYSCEYIQCSMPIIPRCPSTLVTFYSMQTSIFVWLTWPLIDCRQMTAHLNKYSIFVWFIYVIITLICRLYANDSGCSNKRVKVKSQCHNDMWCQVLIACTLHYSVLHCSIHSQLRLHGGGSGLLGWGSGVATASGPER